MGAASADRRDAIGALHARLANAVEQLVTGADWMRAVAFAARFRSRSFGNTLLIWTQHLDAFERGLVPNPEPSYVAGYQQWQALGRQVSKGQPGFQIMAPVTGRFATSTPQDAGSWRRLGRFETPKPGEMVRSRMIGARPAYVWDVSQTTGAPVPERPAPVLLQGDAPAGLWDGLAALVEADGYRVLRVEHERMIGGANGLTDHRARTVAVRTNMDDAAQVKTLAHELGHVHLHGPENPDWAKHRGVGEVEAESVALMIGAAHGMDTTAYTIPYVASWASTITGQEPAEAVHATGERVRKAAGAILDALDTVQLGGGDPPGLARVATDAEPARRTAHGPSKAAEPPADVARPNRAVEPAVPGL